MRRGPKTGGGGGRGWGVGFARGQERHDRRWAQQWSGCRRVGFWDRDSTLRSPETERDELQREEAALEIELKALRSRIAELNQS